MASSWDGSGVSQADFMYKDEVILVDSDDKIIGHDNKYNAHRFVPGQPRGKLHRAFSVFLFNKQGKLLLQKRASTKITFPGVWTNTCCSHQLYGYDPTEVDSTESLTAGANAVPGAKRAATRKLEHELGIKASDAPRDMFKFLTRLHYYAADTVTHGPASPWGEHEIDYILVAKVAKEPPMAPCPDEVEDTKWVSQDELKKMMADPTLLWSPWFRIIVERFLFPRWWKDLDATLKTEACVEATTIHRFDPPPGHRGGAGVMGVVPEKLEASKKQGGYGKVPVHSSSKLLQLLRLDEVAAALVFKAFPTRSSLRGNTDPDVEFCDAMLGKVSRSFAAVIRQLPEELCLDVLVFYLVLRGLDTVEDDMTAYPDPAVKIRQLQQFYKEALGPKSRYFSIKGVGEGDEKRLLENFGAVSRVFLSLPPTSREVISDITKQMGAGMAEFVSKDLGQGTITLAEYNLYCHYVAGLVGEGLSRLFSATGIEGPEIAADLKLADSMGRFLQKANIIRDFLEDYVDGRAFWPAEVWGRYAKTGQLGELALPESQKRAVACLNELVTEALELAPDCLTYIARIRDPDVFRFCAIPQVMAVATLAELHDNPLVFTGVVKLRKGLACKMILGASSLGGVCNWFDQCARRIVYKVRDEDPSARRTRVACSKLWQAAKKTKVDGGATMGAAWRRMLPAARVAMIPPVLALLLLRYVRRAAEMGWIDESVVPLGDTGAILLAMLSVGYLLGQLVSAVRGYLVPRRPSRRQPPTAVAADTANGDKGTKKKR